jgi:ethanolamine permease
MYHNNTNLPSFRTISKDEEGTKIDGWTVWAIGVGSAMGGVFFGWEFVLYGGFVSGLFALVFVAIFYFFYAQIITELSVRYQSSGGSFDFVMDALGIRPAIVVAIMNMMKLICANAATALAISSYLSQGGLNSNYKYLVWVSIYGIFTTLDCIGIKQSSVVQVLATILCIGIVVFYVGSNLTVFDSQNLLRVPRGTSKLSSMYLFVKGLPFAIQFFDGFEEMPLLFSYTKNAEKTMPTAISACYLTILVIALGVLVSASAGVNVDVLLASEAPLMIGIDEVYGRNSTISTIMACLIVIGLLVNFFAFVVFTSQQLQAIAEANLLPRSLAYREVTYGAPVVASMTSMILGLFLTLLFEEFLGEEQAQNTLLMASIFPSMICYIFVLQCIVRIRFLEQKGIQYLGNFTGREFRALGHAPGANFYLEGAVIRARVSQVMVFLLMVALLILAMKSFDYMYGLLFFAVMAVLMFLIMSHRARFDIRDERKTFVREQEQLNSLLILKRQQSREQLKAGNHPSQQADREPHAMGIGRSILEGREVSHFGTSAGTQSSISIDSLADNVSISGGRETPRLIGQDNDELLVAHITAVRPGEEDDDYGVEENTPFLSAHQRVQDGRQTSHSPREENYEDEDDHRQSDTLFSWILNSSDSSNHHSYQTIR